VSGEGPVVGAERSIGVVNLAEVRDNVLVVASLVPRVTTQVTAEVPKALVVLLECDDLGFNLANLLGDDSLGHFLEYSKSLLDDRNVRRVANFLAFDHSLAAGVAVEVIGPIKVVEVVQTRDTIPVVERGARIVMTTRDCGVFGDR